MLAIRSTYVRGRFLSTVEEDQNLLSHRILTKNCRSSPNCTQKQTLILDTNDLEDSGTTILAEYLAKNMTLRSLNLARNSVGNVGTKAIAEMLKVR